MMKLPWKELEDKNVNDIPVSNPVYNIGDELLIIHEELKRLQKYYSTTAKVLGVISMIMGALLTLMAVFSFFAKEDVTIFAIPAPFFLVIGAYLYYRFYFSQLTASLGILLITETWLVCFTAATLPLYLSGMNLVDAVFEGISGFTTTGWSLLPDSYFDGHHQAIMLWRSLTGWVGGITVVTVFAFLLPMIGMGGRNLGTNEMGGNTSEYSQNVRGSASTFFKTFFSLTLLEAAILTVLGMTGIDNDHLSLFNSICIAFSNVATGGLLPFNDSISCLSFPTQMVTLVFMILGATNYFLLIRSISQRKLLLFKNTEWRIMITWFSVCAALIAINLITTNSYSRDIPWGIWESVYSAVAAGTSTGYAISDYATWPTSAMIIMLILQFVGGCSGSTAAGMKIHRLMAVWAYIKAGMLTTMHPSAISVVKVNGRMLDSNQESSVLSTVLLFIVALILGTLAIEVLEDTDISMSLVYTVSAIGNSGALLGTGGIGVLTNASKLLLCFLMYLGRMEMVYVLMIFTRRFWFEVSQSTRKKPAIVQIRVRPKR